MSAFATNAGTTDTEITEDDPITDNFLDHLVGDGKKFESPEALAKGKYEADKFVDSLKRQVSELREDLDKGAKLEELMELVRNQNKQVPSPDDDPVVDPGDTSSDQMTKEQLQALIEDHVSERDRQTNTNNNIESVERALKEKFGESSSNVVATRAAEVGMSVDEMKHLAGSNPKAFLRLVGVEGTNTTPASSMLGTSKRSESGPVNSNAGTRTFADYQSIRKKDSKLYYDPKTQMQMIKDAEKLGEAFYSN